MKDVILPVQLEYLVKALKNTDDNVWQRQNYRDQLFAIMKKLEGEIHRFDLEYAKASKTVNQKKKIG